MNPEENTQKTIELGAIETSNGIGQSPQNSDKKPGFFEKGIKKMVNFVAKKTGQPDPEGTTATTNQTNGEVTSAPTVAQGSATSAQKEPSFFDKLVAGTQKLLNKTENVASTITTTTKNIVQGAKNIPGKVADTTNTVIQKGVNLGEAMLKTTESTVKKGLDYGKNLQTSVTEGAKKITSNPLEGIKDMGSGVVKATVNTAKGIGSDAKDLGKHIVQGTKELGSQAVQDVKAVTTTVAPKTTGAIEKGLEKTGITEHLNPEKIAGKIKESGENILNKGKEMGASVVNKTKEVGNAVVQTTKEAIKNPIEKIDSLAGRGGEKQPIQTETENTTHIDNLEETDQQ